MLPTRLKKAIKAKLNLDAKFMRDASYALEERLAPS